MASDDAWKAGVPEELIPLAEAQIAFVERTAATVPGSEFESASKPATHDPWENICEEKNMRVFRQQQKEGPPIGVGVCHMPGLPVDVVAPYLADANFMGDWDSELCEKGTVLTPYNADAALGLLAYYGEDVLGVQVVAPRELKIFTVKKKLAGGAILVASFSVPETFGPPLTSGKTRARLVTGGGVIVPDGKDGCRVTFLTQIDFGGLLPGAIVAMVSKTQPMALAEARDILTKRAKGEAAK